MAAATNIADLVSRCLGTFPAIISRFDQDDAQTLKLCQARFRLWVSTMGAHRPSGGRSLEHRLRDASWIKKVLVGLLEQLFQALRNLQTVGADEKVEEVRGEDSDVENELDDYFNDSEEEETTYATLYVNSVGHIINNLLRLSVTLRNPAPHDMFESRAGVHSSHFDEFYRGYIRDKFNGITQDEAVLVERLGCALTRRRQYFDYREDHYAKIAAGMEDRGEEIDWPERGTTLASEVPKAMRDERQTQEPHTAPVHLDLSMFDDAKSDLSGTSYQSTKAGSGGLRVPKMPDGAHDGPFLCPYCYRMTEAPVRYQWKKHVYRDLRPYVCLAQGCNSTELYSTRTEWIQHMKQAHWKTWHCQYGCDHDAGTFDSAVDFRTHIKNAHSNTDFDFGDAGALDAICSKSDLSKARGQCPLCKTSQIGSVAEYEKHVGSHLQQIALFALPRNVSDDSDDSADSADGEGDDEDLNINGDGDVDHDDEALLNFDKLFDDIPALKDEVPDGDVAEARERQNNERVPEMQDELRTLRDLWEDKAYPACVQFILYPQDHLAWRISYPIMYNEHVAYFLRSLGDIKQSAKLAEIWSGADALTAEIRKVSTSMEHAVSRPTKLPDDDDYMAYDRCRRILTLLEKELGEQIRGFLSTPGCLRNWDRSDPSRSTLRCSLVSPEALALGEEDFEIQEDTVVLRKLSRPEIAIYMKATSMLNGTSQDEPAATESQELAERALRSKTDGIWYRELSELKVTDETSESNLGRDDGKAAAGTPMRQTFPKKLEWRQGGDEVWITGSMFDWKSKRRLYPVEGQPGCFAAVVNFPEGFHHIVFIVDGKIETSDCLSLAVSYAGHTVNHVEVTADADTSNEPASPYEMTASPDRITASPYEIPMPAPRPNVEDEADSLRREHNATAHAAYLDADSEDDIPSKGEVEQHPIILEVDEHIRTPNPERRFVLGGLGDDDGAEIAQVEHSD